MPDPQPIVIRIKKGTDGRTALSCIRADGTTTWQRQEGKQAAFFPMHDLTHYAVETSLEQRDGFYGLVAQGWNFSDFGSPWPRGRLPAAATISEQVVGVFDLERRTGELATAKDLNARVSEYCADNGFPAPRQFIEEDLDRIRQKRAELFAKWQAVRPGDVLELSYEP